MTAPLVRSAAAELVGTAALVAAVVGSGIAAQRLSPGNPGLQLLENAVATGTALVALILALGPVSGAHFNPVVSLVDRALGGLTTAALGVYVGAQVIGAMTGAVLANLMFELPAVNVSAHVRSGGGVWLGEVVATFGLLIVVLGVARSANRNAATYAVATYIAAVTYAVAAYITAAYWFTSSTSFANPAVTVGRTLSDTFAGIAPSSVPAFVLAQVIGALLALGAAWFLFPTLPTDDVVVPHPGDRR